MKLNVLPGLTESNLDLFTPLLLGADIVTADPRLDRPACVQLMATEAWTESVSGLLQPDYQFGVAEAEGRAACWRTAAPVRNNRDTMWLFPDEASHSPRVMMFGLRVAEASSEGEATVIAEVLTWNLPFDWRPGEVSGELRDALNDLQSGQESGPFWQRFRRFRKQSCQLNRMPGRGCVSRTCDGECRPYRVSDGAGARELCTCI